MNIKLKIAVLFIGLILAGCRPSTNTPVPQPEATLDLPIEAPAIVKPDTPEVAHPAIVGTWFSVEMQPASLSVFGVESVLTTEIRAARTIEFTEQYMLFGDYGHTYSWIDPQRIRVDGIVIGMGSTSGDLFYVLGIQGDGSVLAFLNSAGDVLARYQK